MILLFDRNGQFLILMNDVFIAISLPCNQICHSLMYKCYEVFIVVPDFITVLIQAIIITLIIYDFVNCIQLPLTLHSEMLIC